MRKTIQKYFLISVGVFIVGLLFGVWKAFINAAQAEETIATLSESFSFLKDLPIGMLALLIFANNVLKTFIVLVGGIIFGIIPLVFLFSNGYILGVVGTHVVQKESLSRIVFGLLPHGVIELFAFFLATSYGLWLGSRFLQKIQHREPLRPHVKDALIVFLRVIVPLLFVAALIETFVTPHFMGVRF